jgi:putative NADH-flavin reductase
MTRINVLGGTGYGGAAVAREAAKRGHTVTSYSRGAPQDPIDGVRYVAGSLLDPRVRSDAVSDADVVFVALSPRGDMQGKLEGVVDELVRLADEAGVRLGVLGGVSSVLMSEGGLRFFDVNPPPPEVRPEVQTGLDLLAALQAAPATLDWFYVSPAASFGAWVPEPVTGTYRVNGGILLTDEAGESHIAAPDLALAVLDEIERPRYRRGRLHVAR